jgi:hypothetical protein
MGDLSREEWTTGATWIDSATVNAVLSRMTYKPGWTINCYPTTEGLMLQAFCDDVDSRSGEPKPQFVRRGLMQWPRAEESEALIVAWVRHWLMEWETHEVNERLRLDGEIVHDPHLCASCLVTGCRA